MCVSGLGMENIGGIFVVLICGLIIAVFVAVMEFVWSTRRTAETDEVNLHHRHPPPAADQTCPEHVCDTRQDAATQVFVRPRAPINMSKVVFLTDSVKSEYYCSYQHKYHVNTVSFKCAR